MYTYKSEYVGVFLIHLDWTTALSNILIMCKHHCVTVPVRLRMNDVVYII